MAKLNSDLIVQKLRELNGNFAAVARSVGVTRQDLPDTPAMRTFFNPDVG